MKGDSQQIRKGAEHVGAAIKEEKPSKIKTAVQKMSRQGTSPKDALGLTDAMVEGIYGQAYRLYNTGKYKDASQLFRMLIMINSTEPKYIMGLAACFHLLKEYKNAVETYAILGVIDSKSPVSYYHASDCYVQLKDPYSAVVSLEMAVKRAGDRPEFRTLKDRALLTMESLKKEIAEKNK